MCYLWENSECGCALNYLGDICNIIQISEHFPTFESQETRNWLGDSTYKPRKAMRYFQIIEIDLIFRLSHELFKKYLTLLWVDYLSSPKLVGTLKKELDQIRLKTNQSTGFQHNNFHILPMFESRDSGIPFGKNRPCGYCPISNIQYRS